MPFAVTAVKTGWSRSLECFHLRSDLLQELLAALLPEDAAAAHEDVANESAAGLSSVQLEFGIPIGNGILTCESEEQARARMDAKGFEAARAAIELANLLDAIDEG